MLSCIFNNANSLKQLLTDRHVFTPKNILIPRRLVFVHAQ